MKILILTAFLAEATSLVECIENVEPLTLAKHSCLYSVYHNNELYIANTGISAVAAANTTTALCNALHPDLIFICGRAVGLISGQCLGDLIVGETIFDMDHHDLPDIGDETPFAKWLLDPHSQEPLPYTFNILAKLVNICLQTKLPNVRKGIIASSNISPAPANKMEQLKKLQCDAIEMESAAVCQAAEPYAIPVIAICAIDHCLDISSNDLSIEEDAIKICAERLAKLIMECLTRIDEFRAALVAKE